MTRPENHRKLPRKKEMTDHLKRYQVLLARGKKLRKVHDTLLARLKAQLTDHAKSFLSGPVIKKALFNLLLTGKERADLPLHGDPESRKQQAQEIRDALREIQAKWQPVIIIRWRKYPEKAKSKKSYSGGFIRVYLSLN